MMDPHADYAGDITPEQAWQWALSGEGVIVDVRTLAELAWVGQVPGVLSVVWMRWPQGDINPDFDQELMARAPRDKKLLMLCRSGGRSVGAATRAAELGFTAYNILEGFEGGIDRNGQRGNLGGWRFRGLPWVQS